MFSDEKHAVPFMDGSILADDFYYNAETVGIFFNEETDDYKEIINNEKEKYIIAKKLISGDFYDKKLSEKEN